MNNIPIEITEEQRANFKKLAEYLATGQTAMKFDMRNYCLDEARERYWPDEHTCGTVACALGHGPAAGVEPLAHEGWLGYSERCFCDFSKPEWRWCFSDRWVDVDNTPQGAAARIYYMLENGVPENWRDQMTGDAFLCYEVQA